MAVRCTFPHLTISRKTPTSLIKASMLPIHCHAQPKKLIRTYAFSFTSHKIYEDKARRIIGYRDENGEVIYEGLDEGPRLTGEEVEQVNYEREARTRERILKLLLDTVQADHRCVKDEALPAQNQKMK